MKSNFGQGRFYIFRLWILILASIPLYTQIKFMVWPEKGTELMGIRIYSVEVLLFSEVKPSF
jgi:hypothetical protein